MKTIFKTYQYFQERIFIIRVALMYVPYTFFVRRILHLH